MILGGYTFPWRPEKATIPRGERKSAWAKGLSALGYLAESSILQSKEILLDWRFIPVVQWDEMMVLYRADQQVEWDPYFPMAGGTPSGVPGAEYGYSIGEAVYHGWVIIDAPPYIVNQLTVGQNMYCSNRNDGGATVIAAADAATALDAHKGVVAVGLAQGNTGARRIGVNGVTHDNPVNNKNGLVNVPDEQTASR